MVGASNQAAKMEVNSPENNREVKCPAKAVRMAAREIQTNLMAPAIRVKVAEVKVARMADLAVDPTAVPEANNPADPTMDRMADLRDRMIGRTVRVATELDHKEIVAPTVVAPRDREGIKIPMVRDPMEHVVKKLLPTTKSKSL